MAAAAHNDGKAQRTRCGLNVWLADLTYTQQAVSADLIPQAIGGIAAYAEKKLDFADPIRLFKYPEKLADALGSAGAPDVIGFSNYIWNFNLGAAFARRIKEISPGTIVVFGGPNFPSVREERAAFLKTHPEIDFYIVKEGELAFANLIEALVENGGASDQLHGRLASVQSIDPAGGEHLTETVERIRDLSEIPSPYTDGRLDEFFDGKLLPILQTNRGCPFSCTFCVEGVAYYNKIYTNSQEKVAGEIDYIGAKMAEVRGLGGRNDLFIADSNFGMYKDDIVTCEAIARAQSRHGWPEYINVATGKNQKERVLAAARLINGALRLSGSVQSLDPEVLENIKRKNISGDDLMRLALDAADVGANSYCETILALPGDSKAKHFTTLRRAIEAGFNMVSTFQLMMLPGSEMCSRAQREKFGMRLKYRIFPRCYGRYEVCGREIVSAEIEEICVALDSLSFEEYLECRKMHLVIALFYNDGAFGTVLKFLRQHDYPVFDWLLSIAEAELPPGLRAVFDEFLAATRDELWTDRDELERFVQSPGTIERYIDGELGNNLLFTFKTRAITGHAGELADLTLRTVRALIGDQSAEDREAIGFLEDAVTYHRLRLTDMFTNLDATSVAEFSYDVKAYEEAVDDEPISGYRFERPTEFRFRLEEEQKALVTRYLGVFGDTPWGIGRMMTKVYVKRLLRKAERLGPELEAPTERQSVAGASDQRVH